MNDPIETFGIEKRFGRTAALINVDLAVPEGAIYALVGANGAGKTTLIKLLMNILRPTAGSARVLGRDSLQLEGKAFTRIGYVSENQELPESFTVAGLLNYLRPFYPTWDRALETQLIAQFDLPLDRKLRHLSRGMRMKAAFASSLAYRPQLIILDEPFTGLDALVRDELIEGLLDRTPEATIFLSSHDLAEIESFSSHVGFIEKGRMISSEEMTTLSGRFREVTITFDGPAPSATGFPSAWLNVESAGAVLGFVHSAFAGDASARELHEIFPSAKEIAFEPMPLRSIFLAVAKSHRGSGHIPASRAKGAAA
jgi:ABC-2 type transport system ATP-binding protein